MKKLILTLAATFAALPCLAAVSVNWLTPANSVFAADGTTPASAGWIAQLIWTPDNVASAIDSVNPMVPTDGERLFGSAVVSVNGTTGTARISAGQQNQPDAQVYSGGFVYTRVFNVTSGGGTPTFFGNSLVTGGTGVNGSLVEASSDPTTISRHFASGPAIVVNQAIVVPEPSTYAFLGMGGLMIARRLRKR